jgi:hypothetical protein
MTVWESENRQVLQFLIFNCRIRSCRNCRSGSCWVSARASHKRTGPQLSCRACGTFIEPAPQAASHSPIAAI